MQWTQPRAIGQLLGHATAVSHPRQSLSIVHKSEVTYMCVRWICATRAKLLSRSQHSGQQQRRRRLPQLLLIYYQYYLRVSDWRRYFAYTNNSIEPTYHAVVPALKTLILSQLPALKTTFLQK